MPDYSKSKLYTIRSPHTSKYYIGSTTKTLGQRMANHRWDYTRYLDGKHHFVTSFKILELGDAYIELLQEVPCENKEQLVKFEGQAIRKAKNCVNKCIPDRTQKEYKEAYYETNKEEIIEKQKQYHQANRHKILEKQKEYYESNKHSLLDKMATPYVCSCGQTIRIDSKARHMRSKKHIKYIESQAIEPVEVAV